MVARDRFEALAAAAVQARIADVGDRQPGVVEYHRHQRRAHAGALRLGLCSGEDGGIDLLDFVAHQFGAIGIGCQAGDQPGAQPGDRHLAGDLAGVIAAHAIGQDGKADGRIDGVAVLVVRARHARIGEAGDFKRSA